MRIIIKKPPYKGVKVNIEKVLKNYNKKYYLIIKNYVTKWFT